MYLLFFSATYNLSIHNGSLLLFNSSICPGYVNYKSNLDNKICFLSLLGNIQSRFVITLSSGGIF